MRVLTALPVRTACIVCCAALFVLSSSAFAAPAGSLAVVGGTIIDGNGGAPIEDGVVVISGDRIAAVGRRADIKVPRSAKVVDAKGKYLVPGFIDTNIHLDFFYMLDVWPILVYGDYDSYFQNSLAVEAAQMALKYGVTTILDTYGPLLPLLELRDRINSGEILGPRLLVAGHIIGWGGPLSPSESKRKPADIKTWEKNQDVWYTQGVGAVLTQMYQDEVVQAINKYIDLGPDFLKIGVTTHDVTSPITLSFSPRVLKAIVDTAHARGLKVQAHSGTVEGHRASVDAGIDIITHAGSLYSQRLRPDFAKDLCNSNTHFALFSYAALPAYEYIRKSVGEGYVDAAQASEQKRRVIESVTPDRNRTSRLPPSLESKLPGASNPMAAFRRENQQTLIDAGCKIAVATDAHPATYDDIVGYSKTHADMGIGTIDAIRGLVKKLGMSPVQALTAATKAGAVAAGLADKVGTLEPGKQADLVFLQANPLDDIDNILKVAQVVHNGALLDPKSLPVVPKFYKR